MTSELTTNLRTLLDLIDQHQLPACYIGAGVGGPRYVDVNVRLDTDLQPWADALGTVVPPDDGRPFVVRAEVNGLQVGVRPSAKPTSTAVL